MARIQPNTAPDTKSQELLAGVKKMLGGTPNMFTTMAHSSTEIDFPFVSTQGLAKAA